MARNEERRIDRREALRTAGAAALGWAALPLAGLGAVGAPRPGPAIQNEKEGKKRILFFTRSQTFEHSTVKRKGDELGFAEKLLKGLGEKRGFEVFPTKDGRLITKENLAKYDAFFFYTTGDLTQPGGDGQPPMSPEGKQALLEAVAAGKGFIGSHCADDTFHTKGEPFENQPEEKRDPYIRMLGGEFIRHGEQQEAGMIVASPRFPGASGLGESFRLKEEWYSNKNFAPDIHVILVQDTKGMKNLDYERPPYPATWARKHERGRVFYTSMGHREDVWENAKFQALLLGGIDWVLGRVEADITPNLAAAAPDGMKLPRKPA